MFETWGRIIFRRRRLVLLHRGARRDRRRSLGDRGVRDAAVGRRLQRAGQPEPAGGQPRRHAFGRDAGDVVVLYTEQDQTVHVAAYRAAVTGTLARLPHSRVESVATYWSTGSPQFVSANGRQTYAVHRAGRQQRRGQDQVLRRDQGSLAAPGLTRQAGGQIPTEAAINKRGHQRHRPGRGPVHAGAADPAACHLRQPGGGQPAAGDRRHRHPRLVRRAAAAHPGHPGVDLLDQHHHDPRRSAWLSTTACSWSAGSARNCTGSRLSRTRWPGPLATAGRTVAVSGITVAMALASLTAVPRGVPALDGLRRRGHGAGGHAGRPDRAAGAARGARPEGERAADPPRRAPAAGRRGGGRLVPAGPQRDAQAGGLRRS